VKTKLQVEALDVAEKLHTLDEVAALLYQRPSTIRAWIRDGMLQGTPIGKSWFIMDTDLQAFMEKQRAHAGAELARRKAKARKSADTLKARRQAQGPSTSSSTQ
jgi:excisionase family DNA binding protein